MGLTKMAGMNCFAAADLFSSGSASAGGFSAKKLRGGSLLSLLCKVAERT